MVNLNKKKVFRELESYKETQVDKKYKNLSFSVVLVQPEHVGNVGSIARVMKNFGFENLVIFNPIESVERITSHEAKGFAMHGKDILFNAKIINVEEQEDHISKFTKFMKKYDLIIASTAKGSKYTNLRRLAVFPEDVSIPASEKPLNIAILFGKESRGLTNDEIALADILMRIPTSNEYPTMNLSHACGIVLYEIFKKITITNIGRGENPILLADKEDRIRLYKIIESLMLKLKIRQYREENLYFAFKNVFERALISKKELSLIMGLFSKMSSTLEDINIYDE